MPQSSYDQSFYTFPGARPARRPNRRAYAWPWLAAGAAALLLGIALLPVVAVLGLYAYFQVTERIIPGVYAGPVALEGLTIPEAAAELHAAWNLNRKILLNDGIQYRELDPASLGLSVDPAQTAGLAYAVGREAGLVAGVKQVLAGYRNDTQVALVINFDPDAARRGLEALSGQVGKPPVDASFYLEGARLVAVPGKLGYALNIDETLALLASDPYGVATGGVLPLKLMPVAPQVNDVSASMAEAQRLLDTPVNINAYDPVTDEYVSWSVTAETIASWLRVEPATGGPQVVVDETRVAAYLSGVDASLGGGRAIDAAKYSAGLAEAARVGTPFNLLYNHRPTTYRVEAGDTLLKIGWKVGIPFWMILEANPGLDPEKLWAGQEITLPSKDDLLPLPVVANKRIVISIGKQRMWVYENGQRREEFIISTGIDRSPTQPGIFQVQTHERKAYASVWDLHMPNFLGIYEAWPGFMNGIHGLPTLSNGQRLWANILGRPASYGCIILDLDDAQWLYNWAEDGVVVEIRG